MTTIVFIFLMIRFPVISSSKRYLGLILIAFIVLYIENQNSGQFSGLAIIWLLVVLFSWICLYYSQAKQNIFDCWRAYYIIISQANSDVCISIFTNLFDFASKLSKGLVNYSIFRRTLFALYNFSLFICWRFKSISTKDFETAYH